MLEVAKNAYSPGSPSWPGLYAFLATFFVDWGGTQPRAKPSL